MKALNPVVALLAVCAAMPAAQAAQPVTAEYSATVATNVSSGALAPYFIGSLNNGRFTRKSSAIADFGARVALDTARRFSWGAGVEFAGGYGHGTRYERWLPDAAVWTTHTNKAPAIWVQQLYGEIKYRGVFLRAGMKDPRSYLLDETLSSGDLTRSANARGIPGVEVGFIDFQNIPFTRGWVQIQGVIEYGKMTDDGFNHSQFNYYNGQLTGDIYYTYKRCYFRTRPSERFSVTLGMQATGVFGGWWKTYRRGEVTAQVNRGFKFRDVIDMFFPRQGTGSDGFYEGNSLGSWDFKARYRLNDGSELSFVFEWPWEDGSGIGRRNGFDGLWGLYYHSAAPALISGVGIEYLDFRNQSGAIHWAPGDTSSPTLTDEITGADDYYNNASYGAFANYGMSIGTPFLKSPAYNFNGAPYYMHNRARGVHLAVKGCFGADWDYNLRYSWQQAWGSGLIHLPYSMTDNSVMAMARWRADSLLKGLRISATVAVDAGRLRGNNTGFLLGVTYTGALTFNKNK